jgi:N-(2-amino-2-carboxyethyl)-L-glutamate synthase
MCAALGKVASSALSIESLAPLEKLIGNTSLHKLSFEHSNLYTKLEYENCFGSVKDRPALNIIRNSLVNGLINEDYTIIESTSGNFGIALAGICRQVGLRFIAVIDPNICSQKEQLLRLMSHDVIKVTERDATGGYLLNRIKVVNEYLQHHEYSFNPNQYENADNYLSYYTTLGEEICNAFDRLDHAFISVSSGGTIIGVSQRLKEKFPNIKITGVDVEGSMIFSNVPKARKLSGIGASKRSPLIEHAIIDSVSIISENQIISGCRELLQKHGLLVGASAGAAYFAAKLTLTGNEDPDVNAVFITPDSGMAYLDTVYSDAWVKQFIDKD